MSGFVDASIMTREVENGVEFLIVTRWESMEAIAQFAPEEPHRAVVPTTVHRWLVDYDRDVRHYEVVE